MHIAYRKNIVTIFNRVYYLNLTAKKNLHVSMSFVWNIFTLWNSQMSKWTNAFGKALYNWMVSNSNRTKNEKINGQSSFFLRRLVLFAAAIVIIDSANIYTVYNWHLWYHSFIHSFIHWSFHWYILTRTTRICLTWFTLTK